MSESMNPADNDEAHHLLKLLKLLVKEKHYDGVHLMFTSKKESKRMEPHLPQMAMDIYHDICLNAIEGHDDDDEMDIELVGCIERLIKVVAVHAPVDEFLQELLELVEDTVDDPKLFLIAIQAVNILLFRQGDDSPDALEWAINSVITHLRSLSVPDLLKTGYNDEQRRILEEDEEVEKISMFYMMIQFFYEPLLVNIVPLTFDIFLDMFRPVEITRRNLLCCFLIQMLGRPLCFFDLKTDIETGNLSSSLDYATSLTSAITDCLSGDPFYLLSIVEHKTRYKMRLEEDDVYEMGSCNIFLIEEKLPLYSLAIYYYMIFVAKVDADQIPLVYEPLYIFETSLYLIHELLQQNEPPLHEKALQLMEKLLENLQHRLISVSSLELNIYKSTCHAICMRTGYSDNGNVRKIGIEVLRQYIMSFEDEGKYLVIKYLLKNNIHDGIAGYLVTLYKDLVAKSLKKPTELPTPFCGDDFRNLLLNYICYLPEYVPLYIHRNYKKAMSALNLIRYFALGDVENRTGFWNFRSDIERMYLDHLLRGMNFSIDIFKGKLCNHQNGIEEQELEKFTLLKIGIAYEEESNVEVHLDREQKINILKDFIYSLNLLGNVLDIAFECLTNIPASFAKQPTYIETHF